ncbi:translocation/assembly module TamB domain-containing protein [Williamwhitmania taraxaci]|uniref:Translocation and assembly module TamB n=1 Tax=Williamwhitmania taraxaci TaxID=1640674 RepID=A0A1G6U3S0_9BACT|nr:translocation/assembly module TamB domain-containing protein [Williamwhitmania taraxaci]SDD35844.1 translocation and assembly module TamB [Williamwhitmania taraxaci]
MICWITVKLRHKSYRTIESIIALNKTVYDSVFVESIILKANGKLTKSDTTLNAHLLVKNIRNESFQLDSVAIDIDASPKFAYVSAQLLNHDLNTSLKAGINLGKKIRIQLDDLLIGYRDQNWALQQSPATIEIDSVNYRISDFKLASNNTGSDQYVSANGIFSMKGKEDLKLKLANIDIQEMAKLFGQKIDASGNLNLDMHLSGVASSPTLNGTFGIDEAIFNKYEINKFGGNIDYRSNILKLESQIIIQDNGRIELSGELPLHIKLDSASFRFNPRDSVFAHLSVDHFPMAIFQILNLTEEIKGVMDGEVTVKGTVESPDPKGNLQLVDGSLRIIQYGVKYNDIAFKVEFVHDKIKLTTLGINTSDGSMKATGQIDFNSDFYKGKISNSAINVNFNKFNLFDHKQFNVQLTGDATFGGEKDKVVFGGNVSIPKAEVYLPFIFNMMGKFKTPPLPKPILVREMNKMSRSENSLVLVSEEMTTKDSIKFDYFNDLTGKLRIKIPKNTWIKNEDMRVELSGDLELIKNHNYFEVFGTVDIVRGQYDLFGRTFKIDEGTMSFNGGEKIAPEMNIQATYKFRNSVKIQQQLTVNIKGTVSSPSISFMLDGNSINDGDALSYILFGKGLNELSVDQREGVSESASGGSMAENAAASLLSSQLTKFLGNKLDFDYLELKTDGEFDHASLVVGKYLTNDLFVSYEQQFGKTDQKDIAQRVVKLEYELFRFLFLQLNNSSTDSGFDVVFKLEFK